MSKESKESKLIERIKANEIEKKKTAANELIIKIITDIQEFPDFDY